MQAFFSISTGSCQTSPDESAPVERATLKVRRLQVDGCTCGYFVKHPCISKFRYNEFIWPTIRSSNALPILSATVAVEPPTSKQSRSRLRRVCSNSKKMSANRVKSEGTRASEASNNKPKPEDAGAVKVVSAIPKHRWVCLAYNLKVGANAACFVHFLY